MLAKATKYEYLTEEVDLAPLLDVVFILLIFFIVTASFVKEQGIPINKPLSTANQKTHPSIVLQVLESGHIRIQNRPVDVRAIQPITTRLMAENPDADVVVKLAKRAKTQDIVKAIDALQKARVLYPPVSLIDGDL